MKKHIQTTSKFLILACLIVSATWQAIAETKTERVEDFTKVQYSLPYSVEFIAADSNFVKLEGDEDTIDKVKVNVSGNTLKLTKKDSWFDWSDDHDIAVTIGFVSVEEIKLTGSGSGFAEALDAGKLELNVKGSASFEVKRITTNDLLLVVTGSGDISVHDVDADVIETKISGSGDVELAGRTNSQRVSIAGSGDYDAVALKSYETKAQIMGSGDIRIWAVSTLDASIMGSGDIEYYGVPDLDQSISGSGDITHVGETP